MAEISQQTVIIFSPKDIKQLFWSVPSWGKLADPHSEANLGIIRHGGVEQVEDHVPREFKPSYTGHVQSYLDHVGDSTGEVSRALIAWGTRNTFQNLGLPGWSRLHTPHLLRRSDEPWQDWIYQGLCKFQDRPLAIEKVRFSPVLDHDAPQVEIVGQDPQLVDSLEFVVTGQPLLWDRVIVPPLSLLAAVTYDIRHIYHLMWERWQWEQWPAYRSHKAIHDEMMDMFQHHLRDPITMRAAALATIATREGLAITDHYLHSSLGLREDGSLVLLMMHGSLTDIGYAHQQYGSSRAILLDNGGSVGVAYWSKRGWQRGAWGSDALKPEPTYIGQGSYFRPRGHAVLVAELTEDLVEPPFVPRPSATAPWETPPREHGR